MCQMYSYVNFSIYNSNFGDLVSLVLSSLLAITISILDTKEGNYVTTHSFKPPITAKDAITIQRRGDHYNGIVCLKNILASNVLPSSTPSLEPPKPKSSDVHSTFHVADQQSQHDAHSDSSAWLTYDKNVLLHLRHSSPL